MARRRPPVQAVRDTGGDDEQALPDYLRAGRCLEVWAPGLPREPDDAGRWAVGATIRRWNEARDAWLADRGFERRAETWPRILRDHRPWSFTERQLDGRLAQTLTARGLAEDWTPQPAPARLLTSRSADRG